MKVSDLRVFLSSGLWRLALGNLEGVLMISAVWAPGELLHFVRKDHGPAVNITAMIFAGLGTLYAIREYFGYYNNALLMDPRKEEDNNVEDDEDDEK